MSHVTPRETEVIRWMAEGKTACEIGTILGISPIAVNTHIANAKMKLGVFKETALVAAALRNGIIR
ncbi:response regulator transcription factor [Rhizobium leguminosarum]|uniref:response regulator transcription factor n=1 Tax=Rhizobium leguminosarum TaxID=384 RepID=UPI00036DDE9A|nr:helix-turn-helix transcriptional regulator [Rhizobium leguminosarum]